MQSLRIHPLQEDLLKDLKHIMQRLGQQQPEDPVWARNEGFAVHMLESLKDERCHHPEQQPEQRQASPGPRSSRRV